MSINWLVTVPTPQGVEIPTYGNYGGPNYTEGRLSVPGEIHAFAVPPVDALDALFLKHDMAYYGSSDPRVLAHADLELARGIAALPDSLLSPEAHLYAGATELAMVEQINVRHGVPEIFAPGEEAILVQDARNSLEEGYPEPALDELFAAIEQVNNLLAFAGSLLGDGSVVAPPVTREAGATAFELDILVDDSFYLTIYPDVASAGIDPDYHYAMAGWHEGRDPNAYFDTAGYLAHYTDVAAAGIDPLLHYAQQGWREGRDPSEQFDTAGYLAAYPDVALAGLNPLFHFLASGLAEGRSPAADGFFA